MFTKLNFIRANFFNFTMSFLFFCVCLSSIISAQDTATKSTSPPDETSDTSKSVSAAPFVFGTVENKDHKPVANAKVWLHQREALLETTTDDQGQFTFSNVTDGKIKFKNNRVIGVWARHPSQGLGWFIRLRQHEKKPVTVQLAPTATFSGQLTGPNGQPMAGAKITPAYLGNKESHDILDLPPSLTQRFSTTTNAEGKFEIKDIAATGLIMCDVGAEEFDKLQLRGDLDKPLVIKFDAGVPFSGRVTWPEEIKIPTNQDFEFGTVTLTGYSQFRADGSFALDLKQGVFSAQTQHSVEIDREGRFRFDDLIPGHYSIAAKLAPSLPLFIDPPEIFEIKPKEGVDDFKLTAERALQIRGRVVSSENQSGIANATVGHSGVADDGTKQSARTTTDKDGKFIVNVRKGKLQLKVNDAPQEFIAHGDRSNGRRTPTISIDQDMVWPDLVLDPACDVTIEVFDENGKPAADALIKIVAAIGYPAGQDYTTEQRTDANGQYVIRHIPVIDTLPIWVRTPTAISPLDLTITPSKEDGPVRIDLSSDLGFRFRCRVVDTDGDPIANAEVSFRTLFGYLAEWSKADVQFSMGGITGSGVTDSDGYFESGLLWSDRSYSLTAKAKGYGQNQILDINGKVGEVVEFKPVVLSAVKATKVVGVVLDSAKQPVQGVRVFAAGKLAPQAKTRTDSAGQFELDDVVGDIRYIFADGGKKYRFGGARLRNQQPLEITIRSVDSPPKGIRKNRKLPREEQLAVARDLFERVWSLQNSASYDLLKSMTVIDPDRALEMALASRPNAKNYVYVEQAKRTVDEDPKRALQFLQPVRNRLGITTAIALGMKLAKSNSDEDKQAANEFAEFALQLIDGHKQYRPQLAILFTAIGQHEKAQALIEAALKPMDFNNLTFRQKSTAIWLAPAIAPYDFEKAKSLASLALKRGGSIDAPANVVLTMVATDHEKAIREIDELTDTGYASDIRDKARYRAACLLLADHPDVAIKLVYQCEEDNNRAQALGRLAVGVAEFDQPQAWKMIDEAFAIHRRNPDAFYTWRDFDGSGVLAAVLAYHAKQASYPDMESVIWRVRAACRATMTYGEERVSSTIKTAQILALVDRIAARDLLNAVANHADQLPRDAGPKSLYDQWVKAWLMVDFGRGVKLLNDELDELEKGDAEAKPRFPRSGMFPLLVAKPEDRFQLLLDGTGIWRLKEDGTESE